MFKKFLYCGILLTCNSFGSAPNSSSLSENIVEIPLQVNMPSMRLLDTVEQKALLERLKKCMSIVSSCGTMTLVINATQAKETAKAELEKYDYDIEFNNLKVLQIYLEEYEISRYLSDVINGEIATLMARFDDTSPNFGLMKRLIVAAYNKNQKLISDEFFSKIQKILQINNNNNEQVIEILKESLDEDVY